MADTALPELGQIFRIAGTIALTVVMGLEREEKGASERSYLVAGVRTFPLVGMLGYILAALSPDSALPVAIGFAGLSGLLITSYAHKLRSGDHGATTEVAVLVAYLVGALMARGWLALASGVTVASVLLLQAKHPLEQFAVRLPRHEVTTFVQFLLVSAVILPVLPYREYTQFQINPYKTWLVVVAVSGISYASYIIQRVSAARRSVLLMALLGGAYSSTVTTVSLAKRGKKAADPWLYTGATLLASGMMYARLALLLWIFNASLGWGLGGQLLLLSVLTVAAGYAIASRSQGPAGGRPEAAEALSRHPLELTTAMAFAAVFLGVSVITQVVARGLGALGIYALAALMGTVDVDPFILGLTQSAGQTTGLSTAAAAIVIAAASNNVMKGIYALAFGHRVTGLATLGALTALGLVSLLILLTLP